MRNTIFSVAILGSAVAGSLLAVVPVAKTVPWVATVPTVAHDTVAGVSTTLKGTSNTFGPTIKYWWDPGDGSVELNNATCPRAAAPLVVTSVNQYSLECVHTYTAANPFPVATLYVQDTSAAAPTP